MPDAINPAMKPAIVDSEDLKKVLSPVSFHRPNSRAMTSPVTLFDGGRPAMPPPSIAEALTYTASDEGDAIVSERRAIVSLADSILERIQFGEITFIVRPGHIEANIEDVWHLISQSDVAAERNPVSVPVRLVAMWNLVAQDITEDQTKALGYFQRENFVEHYGIDDPTTPFTVVEVSLT